MGDHDAPLQSNVPEWVFRGKEMVRRGDVSVNLWSKYLGDEGVTALAPALTRAGGTNELLLGSNLIKDDGACALAQVLLQGTSVRYLWLADNGISDRGASALLRAVAERSEVCRIDLGENLVSKPLLVRILLCAKANREPDFSVHKSCIVGASDNSLINAELGRVRERSGLSWIEVMNPAVVLSDFRAAAVDTATAALRRGATHSVLLRGYGLRDADMHPLLSVLARSVEGKEEISVNRVDVSCNMLSESSARTLVVLLLALAVPSRELAVDMQGNAVRKDISDHCAAVSRIASELLSSEGPISKALVQSLIKLESFLFSPAKRAFASAKRSALYRAEQLREHCSRGSAPNVRDVLLLSPRTAARGVSKESYGKWIAAVP